MKEIAGLNTDIEIKIYFLNSVYQRNSMKIQCMRQTINKINIEKP